MRELILVAVIAIIFCGLLWLPLVVVLWLRGYLILSAIVWFVYIAHILYTVNKSDTLNPKE